MAHAQTNRQGFGKIEVRLWSKALARERRELVVLKVRETEDRGRVQKAAHSHSRTRGSGWHGKGP